MMTQQYKILLVEDDPNLGKMLKAYLELYDFQVDWCQNAESALDIYLQKPFDLCLLDVQLPKEDGFQLAKRIKQIQDQQALIFLTSRTLKPDKLLGFKLGADDYLSKPIDEEEMIARIRAVLNRSLARNQVPSRISLGTYSYDLNERSLVHQQERIQLTNQEHLLLSLLVQYKNRLLPRTKALKEIWGRVDYFNRKSMDVYIAKLRKYLSKDDKIRIRNVHGQGFSLEILE